MFDYIFRKQLAYLFQKSFGIYMESILAKNVLVKKYLILGTENSVTFLFDPDNHWTFFPFVKGFHKQAIAF